MAVTTDGTSAKSVRDQVSEAEWATRVDLAAAYRACALWGWDDLVYTHLSARVPDEDHFLLNPFGLRFCEVTASNLCKVDHEGNLMMPSDLNINPAGYTIHSAVHTQRPEAGCVIHLHTIAGVGVACQARGLLRLGQTSLSIYADVRYHDYEGIALDLDERERLLAALGDSNYMILRNHGLLTAGADVPSALHRMYSLQRSCEYQLAAMAGGAEVIELDDAMVERVQRQARQGIDRAIGNERWLATKRMVADADPTYAT